MTDKIIRIPRWRKGFSGNPVEGGALEYVTAADAAGIEYAGGVLRVPRIRNGMAAGVIRCGRRRQVSGKCTDRYACEFIWWHQTDFKYTSYVPNPIDLPTDGDDWFGPRDEEAIEKIWQGRDGAYVDVRHFEASGEWRAILNFWTLPPGASVIDQTSVRWWDIPVTDAVIELKLSVNMDSTIEVSDPLPATVFEFSDDVGEDYFTPAFPRRFKNVGENTVELSDFFILACTCA